MEITNARIENVTVGFDDRDRLSARMTFKGQHGCCEWGFTLIVPTEVQRLIKLMNYAGVHEVEELNGRIIRKVEYNNFLCGFGHPIEDKFVPTSIKDLMEISESQFEEMLKNN